MDEQNDLEQAIITLLLAGYQDLIKRQEHEIKLLSGIVGCLSIILVFCLAVIL